MKRLASLHYNYPDESHLKSLVSSTATKKVSSFQAINNCRSGRDNNTNCTSSKTLRAANDDYDEVDFQSTSDCNYVERINETIDKSSRTLQNMGSNVSTAGGKGLSGRRTQSSSEFACFLLIFLSLIPFSSVY